MDECKPLPGGVRGRRVQRDGPVHGEAVRVEPMKSKLKAPGTPGTKRLKLKHDNLLSSFAFKFNLRRYITAFLNDPEVKMFGVGAYTRPVFGST